MKLMFKKYIHGLQSTKLFVRFTFITTYFMKILNFNFYFQMVFEL